MVDKLEGKNVHLKTEDQIDFDYTAFKAAVLNHGPQQPYDREEFQKRLERFSAKKLPKNVGERVAGQTNAQDNDEHVSN